MTKLIAGIVLFLSAMFGGSYVLSELGWNHWAHFPSFITAMLTTFAGICLFSKGLSELKEKNT
jgi:hypothetical protein